MKSYRRIEITAFRRRVTIMSGEPLRDFSGEQAPRADEGLRLDDAEDDGMGEDVAADAFNMFGGSRGQDFEAGVGEHGECAALV